MFTPLYKLNRLSIKFGIDLFVKRDDLLPISGGGNKYRKIKRILTSPDATNTNALITTGGLQSNHARVTAIFAARHGWKCGLVLHGSEVNGLIGGNYLISKLTGAEIVVVYPDQIAESIEVMHQQFLNDGYNPYIIQGGGHCVYGALAYKEAIAELKEQCATINWFPDWIIFPSGTGTTQAGIQSGIDSVKWDAVKVVGISVARVNPRGVNVVKESYQELCDYEGTHSFLDRVDFRDQWIAGGYEKADVKILDTIRLAGRTEGLILDSTYTGKAFTALIDMVESGEIDKGSRVLFWHTGGLLNMMSSLYRDQLVAGIK